MWLEKRIKDIPKPIVVGDFNMTDEEKIKAEEDLNTLIMKSTKEKDD